MIDKKKQQLFEDLPIPKAVLTLAIPTILSQLVMVIYNLSDTYFVGMINNPIQNAAVTLAAPVLLAFNAVNNLFGVGSSSMMSRALGKKDYDTVASSCAFGFYFSLICSLLISMGCTIFKMPLLNLLGTDAENIQATAEYLKWTVSFGAVPAILNVVMAYMVRAEGSTLHASIGTMSGCLLNIILDPIFILPWGLNMGAAGAGLATFLSNCVACSYFFILLFVRRKKTVVCIHPSKLKFKKSIITGIFNVGIPAAIQNLLNVTGMTILNNFTALYSSSAIAAMGISHKLSMLPLYVALGIGQGITPLISYNYASKNYTRMKKTIIFSMSMSVTFLSLILIFYQLDTEFLISLFIKDEQVIHYGKDFLKGFSLSLPFLALDFLAVGVYQACGMGFHSFVFAILRKIVLEIPALYILNYIFPLYGLAYAQFVAEFILGVSSIFVLAKMFHKLSKKQSLAQFQH